MTNWFQRASRKPRPGTAPRSVGSALGGLAGNPSATLARDRALLVRWRDGDRDAGLQLLDLYAAHERVVAFRLGVRDPEALLELHQDLVLRMLDQLPTLAERIEASLAGWLAWQVRDLARGRIRREFPLSEAGTAAEPAMTDPNERTATWEAILACRDGLPERERAVFELRYLEGLSLQEVADRLSSNANAVAQNVFRLVRRMRGCLASQGFSLGGVEA
jgi:RNA polymerase sigma factor (sigma-70 family)